MFYYKPYLIENEEKNEKKRRRRSSICSKFGLVNLQALSFNDIGITFAYYESIALIFVL